MTGDLNAWDTQWRSGALTFLPLSDQLRNRAREGRLEVDQLWGMASEDTAALSVAGTVTSAAGAGQVHHRPPVAQRPQVVTPPDQPPSLPEQLLAQLLQAGPLLVATIPCRGVV